MMEEGLGLQVHEMQLRKKVLNKLALTQVASVGPLILNNLTDTHIALEYSKDWYNLANYIEDKVHLLQADYIIEFELLEKAVVSKDEPKIRISCLKFTGHIIKH